MVLNGKDAIDPTEEGHCFWEAQLHLTLPKTGRPTYVKITKMVIVLNVLKILFYPKIKELI